MPLACTLPYGMGHTSSTRARAGCATRLPRSCERKRLSSFGPHLRALDQSVTRSTAYAAVEQGTHGARGSSVAVGSGEIWPGVAWWWWRLRRRVWGSTRKRNRASPPRAHAATARLLPAVRRARIHGKSRAPVGRMRLLRARMTSWGARVN